MNRSSSQDAGRKPTAWLAPTAPCLRDEYDLFRLRPALLR
jgi:hypothetical protein